MSKILGALETLFVIVVALAVVGGGIRLADASLGGLPGGAALVAWAFGVSAVVAAATVGVWARGARIDRGFATAVMQGLVPFALTGLLYAIVWYVLFYGSGHYEKGGYERLASALALLVAGMNVSVVATTRLVARATLRDAARVATVVAVTMLAFVGTFALPMLI
jgi:hypothetical protein